MQEAHKLAAKGCNLSPQALLRSGDLRTNHFADFRTDHFADFRTDHFADLRTNHFADLRTNHFADYPLLLGSSLPVSWAPVLSLRDLSVRLPATMKSSHGAPSLRPRTSVNSGLSLLL